MSSDYTTDNTRLGKHDVFLSFRGGDTRNNFVSFLHRELVIKNGIETYIDYRLGGGEEIEPVLLEKIQESLISIVIFSKNYADSTFCLRELSKILECKKIKDQIIIPVFYQVDPTDIQELRGSFADGLAKLKGECDAEEMASWMHALAEIANLKGWDSNTIKPDTKLVESIVDDVQKKLHQMPSTGPPSSDIKSLVGIISRINEVESLLNIGSTDGTLILGIWGMPGIGKTTIAKVVYDKISYLFEGKCFLDNVREESQRKGLCYLRNQILRQVLEKTDVSDLSNSKIERMLQRKKVLIVLDDVSSHQQLEEILRVDCLRNGSRIIVTSRDKKLLENCCDETYKVTELGFLEAFQLFKLHSFKGIQCPEGFKELSERAVNYAEGNPLYLRVLGSNLYNKSMKEWESVLANLKRTLDTKIQKILKMSYDELDWKEKRIFLDIACFFRRCNRDLVQHTLDGCGFDAESGIDHLIDLSLLNISENNEIWMHDLLQQLGQDIVLEENFDDPRKRSRLWITEDIEHVIRHHKGTETLQAVSLSIGENDKLNLDPAVFEEMCNLRFLEFYFPSHRNVWIPRVFLPRGLTFLPTKLRILRWEGYPLKSLPSNFCPKYLIQLRLHYARSLEKLWDMAPSPLMNLKLLEIYWSEKLISVNQVLSVAPKLEVLDLSLCSLITTVDLSNVPNLKVINLYNCQSIRNIDLSNVPNLEVLCLYNCLDLTQVPYSIGKCTKLTTVDLSFTHIEELPSSICQLKCLAKLNLFGCEDLKSLPYSIGNLDSLTELNVSYSNINGIPASINKLSKLTILVCDECPRLGVLPELPSSLQYIQTEDWLFRMIKGKFEKPLTRIYHHKTI